MCELVLYSGRSHRGYGIPARNDAHRTRLILCERIGQGYTSLIKRIDFKQTDRAVPENHFGFMNLFDKLPDGFRTNIKSESTGRDLAFVHERRSEEHTSEL